MQWLSYGIGIFGLLILGWAFMVSNGWGRQISNAILDIRRRDDAVYAREETKNLEEKANTLHGAIALSWFAFLAFFVLHNLQLMGPLDR